MAYITTCTCIECRKTYQGNPNKNRLCHDCRDRKEKVKKLNWLNERRIDKTIEERIQFIEEWIYENKDKIHSSHITDKRF